MAVKDHSLDEKIIKSATKEFLQYGFRDASLRKISKNAGITTGALYTRYKNKDDLFCAIVETALSEIRDEFQPIHNVYNDAQACISTEKIMEAIRKEEEIYLQIMFKHYEQCILFFCCSEGSSIQEKINTLMEQKIQGTIEFLKSVSKKQIDFDGVGFILSEQFNYYKGILKKGYDKDKAISCMKTIEIFIEAGWRELFNSIL